jgi:hypothetical protein
MWLAASRILGGEAQRRYATLQICRESGLDIGSELFVGQIVRVSRISRVLKECFAFVAFDELGRFCF